MKRDLLNIWRCPHCSSTDFELIVAAEKNEIVTGVIHCRICRYECSIDLGIIHTRPKLSAGLLNEIANARQQTEPEKRKVFPLTNPVIPDEQWLLSLPTPSYHAGSWNPLYDIRYIIQCCKLKPSSRVLDLGAGVCWTSRELANTSEHVVAVDIVDDIYLGLKSAEVYIRSTHNFFERVNASMEHLPFRDQSFDLVLTNCSAHHADSLPNLLNEVRRVLKQGGRYVMSNELTQGWLKRSPLVGNDHYYQIGDYLRLLKLAGFKYTTIFPRSILKSLSDGGQGRKDGRWRFFGKLASRLYRLPGMAYCIQLARLPISRLLGIPLIIIAQPK
ncbi:MAG: class I SAM-dependent methyltransferase [Patescibacteria group bacterium]|nr:class I SAM-dependent methyltransferase [Patescibacteria group bacterium]